MHPSDDVHELGDVMTSGRDGEGAELREEKEKADQSGGRDNDDDVLLTCRIRESISPLGAKSRAKSGRERRRDATERSAVVP